MRRTSLLLPLQRKISAVCTHFWATFRWPLPLLRRPLLHQDLPVPRLPLPFVFLPGLGPPLGFLLLQLLLPSLLRCPGTVGLPAQTGREVWCFILFCLRLELIALQSVPACELVRVRQSCLVYLGGMLRSTQNASYCGKWGWRTQAPSWTVPTILLENTLARNQASAPVQDPEASTNACAISDVETRFKRIQNEKTLCTKIL